MQVSGEYVICGSFLLIVGIAQVVAGLQAIRTGKVIDTRSFHFYKGKAAETYGKRMIQFGVLFIFMGILMIVLNIYSEFY